MKFHFFFLGSITLGTWRIDKGGRTTTTWHIIYTFVIYLFHQGIWREREWNKQPNRREKKKKKKEEKRKRRTWINVLKPRENNLFSSPPSSLSRRSIRVYISLSFLFKLLPTTTTTALLFLLLYVFCMEEQHLEMPMSRPEFSQSLILSISRITTTRFVFVLCFYYSFRFVSFSGFCLWEENV